MNIEEIKQRAEEGNIDAMLQLADQYYHEDDIVFASDWYERAAEAGSINGYFKSMITHSMQYELDKVLGFWDKLKIDAEFARKNAAFLLMAHQKGIFDLDAENKMTCISYGLDAQYHLALAIYAEDKDNENYAEIKGLIEDNDASKAKLLYALYAAAAGEMKKAYELVKSVFEDEEYISSKKSLIEQAVFADAFSMLCYVYRHESNIDAAYEAQRTIAENLQDEDLKRDAEKELKRYRKKLFGGYKYV